MTIRNADLNDAERLLAIYAYYAEHNDLHGKNHRMKPK